ncbi:protease complex subunit PrcB family protein [Cytobacillus suaedae]|nr:protease complex subunit PrcB family protein [Cytobacillus suaedae]
MKLGKWFLAVLLSICLIAPTQGFAKNTELQVSPNLTFKPIGEQNLTDAQRSFIEQVKHKEGIYQQGNFYVISLGEKPNSGYELEFEGQEQNWEQLKLYFKVKTPRVGELHAQVISYPYIAGTVDLPNYTTLSVYNSETKKPLFDEELVNPHLFNPIAEKDLTTAQRSFINQVKGKEGIHQQGNFYVISLGEKPNTGYQLEFVNQEQTWEQHKLYFKVKTPKPGEMYAQVQTYPYIAGTIDLPGYTTLNVLNNETKKPLFEAVKNELNVFQPIAEKDITSAQQSFIDQVKGRAGVHQQGNLYVISLGQKSNGGYQLAYDYQQLTNNELKLYFKVKTPKPGEITTQAISYPYVVGVLNLQNHVKLSVLNSDTKKSLYEENKEESFKGLTDTNPLKEWTVHFNKKINPKSVNEKKLYVTKVVNGKQQVVPTKLEVNKDGKSIKIKPLKPYTKGVVHTIHIEKGLQAKLGKGMGKSVTIPFMITGQEQLTFTYNFEKGLSSWQAGFSDLPSNYQQRDYKLAFEHKKSPLNSKAIYTSGTNQSSDLFMYVKKKLDTRAGLKPNTTYQVDLEFDLLTNVPGGQNGIGGSPGESVFVKAGATTFEPKSQVVNGYYTMNIDKGNQAQSGSHAKVIGNVAKDNSRDNTYKVKKMTNKSQPLEVTTDKNGMVWIVLGTDSGFQGETSVYYDNVKVTLTEVK